MDKNLRDQIIEILSTLWEGIKYARTASIEEAQIVLTDVDDSIQAIIAALEDALPPDRFNVYQPRLYAVINELEALYGALSSGVSTKDAANEIKHKLNLIKKELREEEVRRQIVFMPYKAAMWDALESVWRAAEQDPLCDALVVPIPYFSKSRGALQELFYEGGQFPPYVPITHYTQYDLSQEKPDVIYIHNAYDDVNYVTSVAPQYYTSELKKHTDLLVYIPYYVAGSGAVDEFYRLPGIANVSLVIAQSESEKAHWTQYTPASKVLALGAPQIDKIVNLEKFPPAIPGEWVERSAGKQVIFYNTSISTLLTYNELYIEKMRNVFAFFEGREDLLLLWRPHPLLKTTLKSMREVLLAAYEELEEQYLARNIGIYDTTPDFYAALYLCDAYYGDPSSLLDMFGVAGKPIMRQNINSVPRADVDFPVTFFSTFVENDTMWFTPESLPGLFRAELSTGKLSLAQMFPPDINLLAFFGLYMDKNTVIFTPLNYDSLPVYNRRTHTTSQVPLPSTHVPSAPELRFYYYAPLEEAVYYFGYTYPGIVEYQLETGTTILHDNWLLQNKELVNCAQNRSIQAIYFYSAPCHLDSVLYAPLVSQPCFVALNTKTGHSATIPYPATIAESYRCCCSDGKYIWLFPTATGPVLRYDPSTGSFMEIQADSAAKGWFVYCQHCENEIWAFSSRPYGHLRIDTQTGELHSFELPSPHAQQRPYSVTQISETQAILNTERGDVLLASFNGNEIALHAIELRCDDSIDLATLQKNYISEFLHAVQYIKTPMSAILFEQISNITVKEYTEILSTLTAHKIDFTACYASLYANINGDGGEAIHSAVMDRIPK